MRELLAVLRQPRGARPDGGAGGPEECLPELVPRGPLSLECEAARGGEGSWEESYRRAVSLAGNWELDTTLRGPRPGGRRCLPFPRGATGDLTGTLLGGQYRILRKIGSGGFGAVYEAEDRLLHHRVAIKVMNADSARSPEDLTKFKEEARRLTLVHHPNVVDWEAFGETEDGILYFVMELLVEGEELAALLAREAPLEPRRAARLLLQLLDALRCVHFLTETESILHLDLKPGNVFVLPGRGRGARRELVKVIDFGIGQHINRGDAQVDGGGAPQALTSAVPGPGSEVGVQRNSSCTPEYAAPEHCAHLLADQPVLALDGRADLYSLGVIGYQMLQGELPYPTPVNRRDLLRMHIEDPPRPLPARGGLLRRRLSRFLERCLERDREKRWPDSEAAYEALRRIVRPVGLERWTYAALILFAIATALNVWISSHRPGTAAGPELVRLVDCDTGAAPAVVPLGESAAAELRFADWEGAVAGAGLALVRDRRPGAERIGFVLEWTDRERAAFAVRLPRGHGAARLADGTWYVEVVLDGEVLAWSETAITFAPAGAEGGE